jgi:hypothetical protein
LNDFGQARSGRFSLSPGRKRIFNQLSKGNFRQYVRTLSFFLASVIASFPALLSSSKSRRWIKWLIKGHGSVTRPPGIEEGGEPPATPSNEAANISAVFC